MRLHAWRNLSVSKALKVAMQKEAFTSWIADGSAEGLNWRLCQIGR